MSEAGDKIEELTANLKEYVNIQYQAAVLKITAKVSTLGAKLIAIFVIAFVLLMFNVFIGVTLGFYFSYLTGSRTEGFLIIAGLYLLKGILLIIFRERLIIGPIRNFLIKQLLKDDK